MYLKLFLIYVIPNVSWDGTSSSFSRKRCPFLSFCLSFFRYLMLCLYHFSSVCSEPATKSTQNDLIIQHKTQWALGNTMFSSVPQTSLSMCCRIPWWEDLLLGEILGRDQHITSSCSSLQSGECMCLLPNISNPCERPEALRTSLSLSLSAETSSQFPAQYEVGGGRQEESCSDPSGHSGWYGWPSTAGEKLYFAHIMLAQCEFPCWSRGVSWLTLFYILKPHTWNKLIESNWNRTVYWTCRQNIKKKCVCVGISRVTTWLFLFQNNDFAGQCRACVRL